MNIWPQHWDVPGMFSEKPADPTSWGGMGVRAGWGGGRGHAQQALGTAQSALASTSLVWIGPLWAENGPEDLGAPMTSSGKKSVCQVKDALWAQVRWCSVRIPRLPPTLAKVT